MRTWEAPDPDLGRPLAAPLERFATLLGVDLATLRNVAASIAPYMRADGTRIWSLMQLERQLRPEAFGRRRGGDSHRRRAQPPMRRPKRVSLSRLFCIGQQRPYDLERWRCWPLW
jgi:hypothetical protein